MSPYFGIAESSRTESGVEVRIQTSLRAQTNESCVDSCAHAVCWTTTTVRLLGIRRSPDQGILKGAILVVVLFQSLVYSAHESFRVEFSTDDLIGTVAVNTYAVVADKRDMLPRGNLLNRVAQILGAFHRNFRFDVD
jgi:hypothetical protein